MKKKIFNLLMMAFMPFAVAYGQPPTWITEEATMDFEFKPNIGQVHDNTGVFQPDVLFYTGYDLDQVFFLEAERKRVAHVHRNKSTSLWDICRVDVMMVCSQEEVSCGTWTTYGLVEGTTNYYDENIPDGINNIPGYKAVMHHDAFNNIDVIYNGTINGFKTTFDIKPGGNISDIKLKFEGQNSLSVDPITGSIIADVATHPMEFKPLNAYQLDASGTTLIPLGWQATWEVLGDEATLDNIGNYDVTKSVYLTDEPLNPFTAPSKTIASGNGVEWSTRYGSGPEKKNVPPVPNQSTFSHENGGTIRVDQATGDIFHTMVRPTDIHFPPSTGCEQKAGGGKNDIYITKFDGGDYRRIWATYFGGAGDEDCKKMALSSNTNSNHIYLTGSVTGGNLPMPTTGGNLGTFKQNTNHGGADAFVASFHKDDGFRQWVTHFGGVGDEIGRSITIDDVDHKLYIVGTTNNPSASTTPVSVGCITSTGTGFPLCQGGSGRYYQNTFGGATVREDDGFIAEFDIDQNHNSLEWSTLFGGDHSDIIYDVLKVNDGSEKGLYICGMTRGENTATSFSSPITAPTTVGDFPLANPGSGAYIQHDNATANDDEAFIAKFDNDSKLVWSTTFGGAGIESFTSLATETRYNDVYAVGVTTTENVHFSTSCAAINSSSWPVCGGGYIQNQLVKLGAFDGLDALITRFSSVGKLKWSTYFGGKGDEAYDGSSSTPEDRIVLADVDNVDNLYIYGSSEWRKFHPAPPTPTKASNPGNFYNQADNASQAHSGSEDMNPAMDVFIAAFNTSNVLAYGTYFGGWSETSGNPNFTGQADEIARDFDIHGHHGIYITGRQASWGTPAFKPAGNGYFEPFNYNFRGDYNLFITRLNGDTWWTATHVPNKAFEGEENSGGIGANNSTINSDNIISNDIVNIAPNPITGVFIAYYNSIHSGEVNVKVSNSLGQVVESLKMHAQVGSNLFNVSLIGQPAGVYYVELNWGENERKVEKIIKQ